LPIPTTEPKLFEFIDPEVEQLPEPEKEPPEERPLEDETESLQVLAFAICVVGVMTPGIRSMVKTANTALIENANLCI
jgi:hypothetical protein